MDKVYEVIEIAKASGKVKKGTNEVTKAIERGTAKLVAVAKDVNPAEIVMHIPIIGKEKAIPVIEVNTRDELGAAAGIDVPTVAVAVTDEGDAKKILKEVLNELGTPEPKAVPKEEAPAKEEAKPEEKSE